MNAQTTNPFLHFWNLGYKTLLPVLPPGAELDESSFMSRPGTDTSGYLGKAPGVRLANGKWVGLRNWQKHVTTEADLIAWHAMGASVGLRLDTEQAIDIDASDRELAERIEAITIEILGVSSLRIGNDPRRMLFYRFLEAVRYRSLVFMQGDKKEKIEVLSKGKQVVVYGTHPKTGKPYSWPRRPAPAADLTPVTPDQFERWLAAVKAVLPQATEMQENNPTERANVDQGALRGKPDLVRKIVEALPNNRDVYPDREDYIRIGAAIKGAMADEAEAFELWCDWAAKDDGGQPQFWEKDWNGLGDKVELGMGWLVDEAKKRTGTDYREQHIATANFDAALAAAVEEAAKYEPLFPERPEDQEAKTESSSHYEVLTVDAIFNRPDAQFLIDRHVPEASVGFLYGDPGTGKSFIALDWALHLAYDRETWHGDPLRGPPGAAVIYLAGEGASGFKTRVAAWMARHAIPADQRGRFGLIHQSVNFMVPTDVQRLLRTLREVVRVPVAAVIVDTVSRSMPGADENLQKEMTLFVKACDMVKDAFQCAVIGVHHAGKSGDMRGSTVLRGAGDFVFKLERKKGASVGHLHCEKMKDAPDGWSDPYRFDVVTVGADKSSLVPMRCETRLGDDMKLTPDVASAVLEAMREAWESGEPWGKTYHAGDRQAARQMVKNFGFDMDAAEQVLGVWLGTGMVVEDMLSAKSKRKGLRVSAETVDTGASSEEDGGPNAFE